MMTRHYVITPHVFVVPICDNALTTLIIVGLFDELPFACSELIIYECGYRTYRYTALKLVSYFLGEGFD